MPELPDIAAYISALEARTLGQPLERVRLASVFLLRTVDPPLASAEGRAVVALRRVGKRIAIGVEGDLWLVLHVVRGEEGLYSINPGGVEIFETDLNGFRAALTLENRTLKRALTDPRLVSGIGNAYSDEILHAAHLSPITLTHKLKADEWERLFSATRSTLSLWTERLRKEAEKSFPEGVTAFRPEF